MAIPIDDICLNKASIMERALRRVKQEYLANPALDDFTHIDAMTLNYEIGHFRIHNLGRLLEIVKGHIIFDAQIDLIAKLDKLYIDARYPADLGLLPDGKPTMTDAKSFQQLAKTICNGVRSLLEDR